MSTFQQSGKMRAFLVFKQALVIALIALGTQQLATRADAMPYHMGANAHWLPAHAALGRDGEVQQALDGMQRLGLKTLRLWAFNTGLPSSPGNYDESQFRGLDAVIAGAGRRGMQVVLALTNLWAHYQGPEDWLQWAEGSAAGKTVEDFYKSNQTRALIASHIRNVTSRINSLTGVAYRDDSSIMGWDLMNEPRCPGCSEAGLAARDKFISSLLQVLKAAAPNQLTFSATEGFFAAGDPNVAFNPGAGAQCEGEDWTKEIGLFDVATAHIYHRQVEEMRDLGWRRLSFAEYVNFLHKKLQLYTSLAAAQGKDFVVEEFGLSAHRFDEEQRKVVFAVVADALIVAKRAGSRLKAALFWGAAIPSTPGGDGYKIDITEQPTSRAIGLGNPPALNTSQSSSSSSSNSSGSSQPLPLPLPALFSSGGGGGRPNPSAASAAVQAAGHRKLLLPAADGAVVSTTLQQQQQQLHRSLSSSEDSLDGFRRASARAACAVEASKHWKEAGIEEGVNVAAYSKMVASFALVDIIAEACMLLAE